MKRYLVIFLIITANALTASILTPNAVFSQTGDTVRTQIQNTDTTSKPVTPFDTNKIPNAYRMSNSSVTYGQSNWIWNDRRNLGEILNERPGFHINFISDGGRSILNYNRSGQTLFGVFKDGIQINDNFFGGFDIENISVNEIDTIEEISLTSSFLYGIKSQGKAINIITKDVFQPELFSQLRFTQDRYGSEYADVYFSQSISRKLNWQIGATKHSLNGRYENSDFDVWRARFRVNWFVSPKANLRFNLNYANIIRGLNEGLIDNSEDTLRNSEFAKVENPDSYEKLTNFFYDLSFTGRFFKNKNSQTKIKLYSQNSLREYRDEEGNGNSNGKILTKNFHSIQYALDLKQNFSLNLKNDVNLNILFGGNVYYTIFNFDILEIEPNISEHINRNYYTAFSKLDFNYKKLNISLMGKFENFLDTNLFSAGVELNYDVLNNEDFNLNVYGGANIFPYGLLLNSLKFYPFSQYNINTQEYSIKEVGFKFGYRNFFLNVSQYTFDYPEQFQLPNGNYEAGLKTKYFDIISSLNFRNDRSFIINNVTYYRTNIPQFFLKTDLSYHNFFFNRNLNLRIGLNLKYMSNMYVTEFSQYTYVGGSYEITGDQDYLYIDHLFNMDAYISARIGSANIAFVFANIFDIFNYDTFLYPWNDRGGALNALSRFTITWDFFN